jgi:hypothetical protein
VTATGLEPGRSWAVFLAREDPAGLNCLARLARRVPREGKPTVFSGTVPATLACPQSGQQPAPVRPGQGYRFVACVPAGGDCRFMPVATRAVRIARPGVPCADISLGRRRATRIRARGVSCGIAQAAARGAAGGERRYTRAGLRCRGTFDATAPARTVYRCTRTRARVTFMAASIR